MRIRTALASAAATAALLAGGTAVAQAAPAPAVADNGSSTEVTPQDVPFSEVKVGEYPSKAACRADGRNSAHARWWCVKNGKIWELWVETNS
ncbi:hypothetical protein AAHZ94_27085 [Streptomyces sp. HSW2009]|uniref:hypothetical protein n=1 Tax=Streptomyces sp. HSW2009 TaxID=3142890 RepID=UPI0032EBA801